RRARARAGDLARPRQRPLGDAGRALVRRLRARALAVIVRWSLAELPATLAEVGIERPFLISSPRWQSLDLPQVARWLEVPWERVEVPRDADGVLAFVGGSAIASGAYDTVR